MNGPTIKRTRSRFRYSSNNNAFCLRTPRGENSSIESRRQIVEQQQGICYSFMLARGRSFKTTALPVLYIQYHQTHRPEEKKETNSLLPSQSFLAGAVVDPSSCQPPLEQSLSASVLQ